VTVFGTNARFLQECETRAIALSQSELASTRLMLSTGSVLPPTSFDYVHRALKSEIQLCSISGGTDLLGCFALGCPVTPVYRGELQAKSLGLGVGIATETGSLIDQPMEKGELVCTTPFPSMPLGFLNDPERRRYRATYFERFPGWWHHGDYVAVTPHGGLIFYGRSDATLNPGGIRIGTSEIYRVVTTFSEVSDVCAVPVVLDGREQLGLLIVVADDRWRPDLPDLIRTTIRRDLSPHFVPTYVWRVPDLPRTVNGKLSEIAIKKALHGETVSNRESLVNPESLDLLATLLAKS
jgi:acetoacetyl-CoA synthetase